MTRLDWGNTARVYDEGLDRGVLYSDNPAVPWNGLISVSEEAASEIDTDHYIDGVRTIVVEDIGDFRATLRAYTYPDEFNDYNGYSESNRMKRFGLSYRTARGDGHRIHLIYNALVIVPERERTTIASTMDPGLFDWDISASAIKIPGARSAPHIIVDTRSYPEVSQELEDILYGTDTTDARLPLPEEIVEMFESATTFRVRHNGDGTWTVTGPDGWIETFSDGRFTISAPTAQPLGESGAYVIDSY